jgi:hypothetical protein
MRQPYDTTKQPSVQGQIPTPLHNRQNASPQGCYEPAKRALRLSRPFSWG